jgi:TRAP-type uncharacterized transport system substrate-binding protein
MRGTVVRLLTRAAVAAAVAVGIGLGIGGGAGLSGDASAASATAGSKPVPVWQSKSTQPHTSTALWDRSVPSSRPPAASGGYAKPATGSGFGPAGGNTSPPPPAASVAGSGGYSKPAPGGGSAGTAASANANPTPAPAVGAPPPTASVAGSGGYTKPSLAGIAAPAVAGAAAVAGAEATPAGGPVRPPAGGFDRGAERQLASQSLARYQAEQQRFSAPPQGTLTGASDYARNPLYTGAAGRYQSYDQAYAARDSYRNSHPWAPPAYAYRSAPSFGMWDALFWWMVLDKITEPSHAAAAYNNANDPGFQAWRREADRQAADNAELKAKLDAMDAKLASMQGQPRKPGTLPEGVPAAVALAPEVAVAPRGATALVMGTGSRSGYYYPFCQGEEGVRGLRGTLPGIAVECRVTDGSGENLDGLAAGNFDAVMVQSDLFGNWLSQHPGIHLDALKATIYQEYVQMLANTQAGVGRIGDLDPKRHVIYLVGSGAQKTWDGFTAVDSRYAEFDQAGRVRRVSSEPAVLDAVAANPDAVMMFISGLKSDLLRQANDRFGDRLTMVLVDDHRFEDVVDTTGHPLYAYARIPGGVYPRLQRRRWFGLTTSVPSLTVGAVFILSEHWVAENGVANLSKVEDALWHVIPEIERKVGAGS